MEAMAQKPVYRLVFISGLITAKHNSKYHHYTGLAFADNVIRDKCCFNNTWMAVRGNL
jgi:hypothetical protein